MTAKRTKPTSLAVLLPTRRPHHAPRFMESLRVTTTGAKVYVCCETDAMGDAWTEAGADLVVVDPDATTAYRKLNLLYPKIGIEAWVFGASDDLVFHPGWFEEAVRVAEETGASVIGTNDLGNPQVLAGTAATHCLLRRSYLDTEGLTLDVPPGGIITEDYVHNWVDNEIVELAQRRGAWAMAIGSYVEHLHPLWGKAPRDAVYDESYAHAADDAATFTRRMRAS